MTPAEADALVDRLRAAFAGRAWGDTELVDLSSALLYLDRWGAEAVVSDAISAGAMPRAADLGRLVARRVAAVPAAGRAAAAKASLGTRDPQHWHGGPDPCPVCLPWSVEISLKRGEPSGHLDEVGWTIEDCRSWWAANRPSRGIA